MKKDPVIEKLLEYDRRLHAIETRLEQTATKEQVSGLIELVQRHLVTVDRLDSERKVQAHSIQRLHDRDQEQQVEIDRIKTKVEVG